MEHIRGGSYRVMSEKEITEVHETSISILEEVGFETSYTPLLQLLEDKGAAVDWHEKRVYLPRELVSRCIKQAPSEFVYYGLEKGNEIYLGEDRVYFGAGGKALYVLEEGQNRRKALLKDVAQFACLTDKLEYVDFYIIPVHSHDVNINHLDINDFYHAFKNTGKPVMGGVYGTESQKEVIELCSMLAGDLETLQQKPFVGFITAITSPLKVADESASILMQTARYGLPLVTSTAPIAGVTAPVTLAGTLALQNAEALLGIVLSQVVNPGTPVFYSAVPCTMDMRTGTFLMGGIESGLMNAAVAQMSRYYRVPCYVTVGVTDSKLPDAQSAYESATNCLLGALSGGNFLHEAFGFLDGALTISYAKFIIDNDIVGSCMRALSGIEVDRDTLGFDVVAEVGPGGNFLMHQHTVEYMRKEMYTPRVSFRQDYHSWLKSGQKDSWQKADEIARQLLEEPHKQYFTEEMEKKILSAFPKIIDLKKAV